MRSGESKRRGSGPRQDLEAEADEIASRSASTRPAATTREVEPQISAAQVRLLEYRWAIGLYQESSPLVLAPARGVENPVLDATAIDDVEAAFVADPFHLRIDGTSYLFFEIWNRILGRGEIGCATSPDGRAWSYEQVVLREPFHLSYPCVFRHRGRIYMIPETRQRSAVRLYQAEDFPRRWVFVKDLLHGDLADATPFHHQDRWWLFVHRGLDELRLFSAGDLLSRWQEHPSSPLVAGNRRLSRPAGRVVCREGRILRFAQDAWPHYGSRVRALEIERLSRTGYSEEELPESPILEGGGVGWNALGMHHVELVGRGGEGLVLVDGFTAGSWRQGRP